MSDEGVVLSDVEIVLSDVWVRLEVESEDVIIPDQLEFGEVKMRASRRLTTEEVWRALCAPFRGVTEVGWTDEDGVSHVRGAP